MSNVTVNISFQDALLQDIDRVAQSESRSRSELLREAARSYIQRKERWAGLFRLGAEVARTRSIKTPDVEKEIAAHRKAKAAGR